MGILHRDIKAENILIDGNNLPKLADFGLSKQGFTGRNRTFTFCGMQDISAPEMIGVGAGGYTFAIDWWSFGCLLYDLLCGFSPFYSLDKRILQENILRKDPIFPEGLTHNACDLISQLLKKDPAMRLTDADLIKRHPFFASVDWSKVEETIRRKDKPKINQPQNSSK